MPEKTTTKSTAKDTVPPSCYDVTDGASLDPNGGISTKTEKKELKKPYNAMYEKLSKQIPKESLLEYEAGGKTFTGYKSQYAIDLLNEVLGIGKWATSEEVLKQETLKKGWTVAMSIKLSLCDERVLVTGYGAQYAKDIANAYKGAKTSAFKNACRYLGIGKELYAKGFDDDVVATTVAEEELPSEQEGLVDMINNAETLPQLESLLPEINRTEGEAVKKALIKKYNDQKIKLAQ